MLLNSEMSLRDSAYIKMFFMFTAASTQPQIEFLLKKSVAIFLEVNYFTF